MFLLFKLDEVKRAYYSSDLKDIILGFADSDFTVKASEELWNLILTKINN